MSILKISPASLLNFALLSGSVGAGTTPMLIRFGGSGGRSIAWVLRSSDNFVLGSCDVDTSMFEGSKGGEDVDSLLPDGKIYVVLDRIGNNNEPEKLSFGLKVVNQKGGEMGAGTRALLVTEKSVGLISIQAWFNWGGRKGNIDEDLQRVLKGVGVRPIFDVEANHIDGWLGRLEGEHKQGKLINTIWWEAKDEEMSKKLGVKISARWQSWCGTVNSGTKDKKLSVGRDIGKDIEGGYKSFTEKVDLTVGSINNATAKDKWALIPIGKPIMKINLSPGSFNNETIEGTLEPMKDSFLQWGTNFNPSITFSLKK